MNQCKHPLVASLALTAALSVIAPAWSSFATLQVIYQGRLKVGGGNPDIGQLYDVQFRLFDAPAGGIQLTDTITQVSVLDSNGLFRALVDLGPNAFGSDPRWLELGVRRAGAANEFAILAPRQRIGAVPISLHAQSSEVATSIAGVISPANLPPSVARLDAPQVFTVPPSFMPASGPPFNVGVTDTVQNLSVDLLDGLDSTQFWRRSIDGITETMGPTINTHALELVLGADRVLRLQPGDSNLGSSTVGGSANNHIATGVPGAVVAGGRNNVIQSNADYAAVSGGDANEIGVGAAGAIVAGGGRQLIGPNSDYSGILGGYNNLVESNSRFAGVLLGNGGKVRENSDFSAVMSGENNAIGPQATYAAILSGGANQIQSGANLSVIVSGQQNSVRSNAYASAIVSGQLNRIHPGANRSTLVGGGNNEIGPQSYAAFLGGGADNRIEFNAPYSAILGGNLNLVRSNAGWATVLGGVGSVAGAPFAIAAGHQARAEHSGSLVLADGQYAEFPSLRANEFAVRAAGGARFETAGAGLTVDGVRLTGGGGGLLLPAGSVNASNLLDGAALAEILDDDGAGSGLDADRLDGMSSEDFWRLTGNADTTAANFLGTTDDMPLVLRVNNTTALRLLPDVPFLGMALHSPNLVGGSLANGIADGNGASVIAGGGSPAGVDIGVPGVGGVAAGGPNYIDASFANVDGGSGNSVRAHGATIGGGNRNQVREFAAFSVIGGGDGNRLGTNAPFSTIAGGRSNAVVDFTRHGTVSGGGGNQVAASYATVPGGRAASAISYGQQAYASGAFALPGDAQSSLFVVRGATSNTVPVELFLDGASQRLKVPRGAVWTFDILIAANGDGAAVAGYHIRGVVANTFLDTEVLGNPEKAVLYEAVPEWDVTVEGDAANDALVIKVIGMSGRSVRWVASVRTVEVVI